MTATKEAAQPNQRQKPAPKDDEEVGLPVYPLARICG